jgi:XRE family transcriptional regulator, regulator of sulfur utilization
MRLPPARRHRVAVAFGAALKAARGERGFSQEELSEGADLDRTTPSLYERGIRSPTLAVLFEMARVLDVEPTQLVADTLVRLRRDAS